MRQIFQNLYDRLTGRDGPGPPPVPRPDLSTFRKPTWEGDISLNHDSTEPFENGIPPCEMPREAFNIWSRVSDELLEGRSLDEFIARDRYPIPHPRDREGYDVGPYRALTFHSDKYLQKTWGRFFEIAEIVPMGHGICQSVVIGFKR